MRAVVREARQIIDPTDGSTVSFLVTVEIRDLARGNRVVTAMTTTLDKPSVIAAVRRELANQMPIVGEEFEL